MRPRTRRIVRHGTLALGVAVSVPAVGALVAGDDPIFFWSMGTAYVGMALWAATLLLGPWNVVRRQPNPVSTHLRRDFGIWAALVSCAHVVFGLQRHFRGAMERYFFPEGSWAPRLDTFGLTNWGGAFATVVLLVLLALSNDRSLGWMGSRTWKWLQRLTYPAFAATVLHAFIYQALEDRTIAWIVAVGLTTLGVVVAQGIGWRRVRAEPGGP